MTEPRDVLGAIINPFIPESDAGEGTSLMIADALLKAGCLAPVSDNLATTKKAIEAAIGYDEVRVSIDGHPEIHWTYRTAIDRDGLVVRLLAAGLRLPVAQVPDAVDMTDKERNALVEAAVDALELVLTNRTHAYNTWNYINASDRILGAILRFHTRTSEPKAVSWAEEDLMRVLGAQLDEHQLAYAKTRIAQIKAAATGA